jgi:hypothetical protein
MGLAVDPANVAAGSDPFGTRWLRVSARKFPADESAPDEPTNSARSLAVWIMRPPPTYTTWNITCGSHAECEAVREWLSDRIKLDRVWVQTIRTMSGGVEDEKSVPHRLGDYFTAIRTLTGSQNNSASFLLVFQRRPDAGRFWKDLMVNVLQEIETSPERPVIALESKGERDPGSLVAVGSS